MCGSWLGSIPRAEEEVLVLNGEGRGVGDRRESRGRILSHEEVRTIFRRDHWLVGGICPS
jgi:hypothetical protein